MSPVGTSSSPDAPEDGAAAPWAGLNPLRTVFDGATDRAREALRTLGQAAANVGGKLGSVAIGAGEGVVVATAYSVAGQLEPAWKAVTQVRDAAAAIDRRFSPARPVRVPCVPCLGRGSGAERAARIERRQALSKAGSGSSDPAVRDAARSLTEDTRSVELARLSENAYAQFDKHASPADRAPPAPWRALSPQEAAASLGVKVGDLSMARAVVYQAPPDFPFQPGRVLAFRGTSDDPDDLITDHDQALGLETQQYDASVALGTSLKGTSTVVTGHSLGGGKAMAAAVVGGLNGEVFNAAGLHPNTVHMTAAQLAATPVDMVQVRAGGGPGAPLGDPLTAIESSPGLQHLLYDGASGVQALGRANLWALDQWGIDPFATLPADQQGLARALADRVLNVTTQQAKANERLSGGAWMLPPIQGTVRPVTSLQPDGSTPPPLNQHFITPLVAGLEARKAASVDTLLAGGAGAGLGDARADYLGPGA